MTNAQLLELESLKKDLSIVIQSADKGGVVVILDRKDYAFEIQRQLSNSAFYKKLSMNPLAHFKTSVHNTLQLFVDSGLWTKGEYEYMCVEHLITPVLYTLPKIPKQYREIPPGRPIVAAIGSLTEQISAFVDFHLQPLVTSLPSYIKNTMEFIELMKNVK